MDDKKACQSSQNNNNSCDHQASFLAETQLILSCSKSTIEIVGKGGKYVQSYQYKHIEHISQLFLLCLLLTLNK